MERRDINQEFLSAMSQQLQISSLFSAFALVALCLFARVGVEERSSFAAGEGPATQVMTSVAAKG